MSKHITRAGGKFGGSHKTFIPAAAIAADTASTCEAVTNIASGIINIHRGKSGNRRHVKIIDINGGILLLATDGAAHQEVHVYTSCAQETKLHIACGVRSQGLTLSFGNRIPQ